MGHRGEVELAKERTGDASLFEGGFGLSRNTSVAPFESHGLGGASDSRLASVGHQTA